MVSIKLFLTVYSLDYPLRIEMVKTNVEKLRKFTHELRVNDNIYIFIII